MLRVLRSSSYSSGPARQIPCEGRRMKFLKSLIFVVIGLFLQLTLAELFRIGDIAPDILLITLLLLALTEPLEYLLVLAALGGFALDIFNPTYIGVSVIAYTTGAFLIGNSRINLYSQTHFVFEAAVLFLSTLVVYAIFAVLIPGEGRFLVRLVDVPLGEAFYTTIFSIPFLLLVGRKRSYAA